MKRSATVDLGAVDGPGDAGHRVGAPSGRHLHTDDRPSGGRRSVLWPSLVVLLLAASGGAVVLLRRPAERVAAPLPPPAPAITGLTVPPLSGLDVDTPGGAAGTVSPPAATSPAAIASTATAPAGPSPAGAPSADAAPATGDRSVSGPTDGLRTATFELASGTSTIVLRTAAIGDDLYRISASAASRQQPRATVSDGTLRLTLTRTGKGGKGEVQVVLNAAVRWSLRISASLSTGVFDLGNGKLTSARFAGDAAGIDLRTPRPSGTLPVRITGGINRFRVQTDGATPARVRIRDGAGAVVLDGRTTNGVAPDSSFTGRGFTAADDRIDVDAQHGIGSVTVAPA